MQYQKPYRLLYFLLLLLLLQGVKAKAQNVTSPYSALGIGDIDTKDYGRYFASGSTSIARRDEFAYNFSNPASLTSLPYKRMDFDLAMRGTVNFFQLPGTDTLTATSKDFAIKRFTMAIKLTQGTAIAFGLRPYSSVSYQYETFKAITNGNQTIDQPVDGSGGVDQVYFSIAKFIGKPYTSKVSVGITPSYLFGSLQKLSTSSSDDFLLLNITKQEITTLYGANLQAGIQYDSYSDSERLHAPDGKIWWEHRIGLTATISTELNGQLTTDYINNINPKDTFIPELVVPASFKLPTSVGFGYSATSNSKDSRLTLSFDMNYSNWANQVVYTNTYTSSTLRLSAGIEYSKLVTKQNFKYEKYFLAAGFSGENSYLMVNDDYLKDYSFSFGGGFNLFQKLSVYGGIELGIKGSLAADQIKESYSSFVLGFTFKDLWYGTKKFGKFY